MRYRERRFLVTIRKVSGPRRNAPDEAWNYTDRRYSYRRFANIRMLAKWWPAIVRSVRNDCCRNRLGSAGDVIGGSGVAQIKESSRHQGEAGPRCRLERAEDSGQRMALLGLRA